MHFSCANRKQTINKVGGCNNDSQISATNIQTTEANISDVSNCQVQSGNASGNAEDNRDEYGAREMCAENVKDLDQVGLIEPVILGKQTHRSGFKQRPKDFGTWFKNYVKRVCVLVL